MNILAAWSGYVEAMYYTGKMAYFKRKGQSHELHFVCHVKEYNPRLKPDQFMDLVDIILFREMGSLKIERIRNSVRKYINIRATVILDNQTYVYEGVDGPAAVVKCIENKIKNDHKNQEND